LLIYSILQWSTNTLLICLNRLAENAARDLARAPRRQLLWLLPRRPLVRDHARDLKRDPRRVPRKDPKRVPRRDLKDTHASERLMMSKLFIILI